MIRTRLLVGAGATLLLASCSSSGGTVRALETAPPAESNAVADYPVKLGEPYQLGGVTYTPADTFNYDETGYASWYGGEMAGRPTANGELFNGEAISGAHRTLPLPSYVEVTALDTGKTILVRLNDRGPVAGDRLIDLSQAAARQLGMADKGVFPVRVRRVNPPETERALLRQGQPVALRMDTPESLLVPLRRKLGPRPKAAMASATTPVTTPATAAAPKATPRAVGNDRFIVEGTGAAASTPGARAPAAPSSPPVAAPVSSDSYFVQVAAFASRARADTLARKIGATIVPSGDGRLFRVRYGPYADAQAAQQGLTLARRNGYQDARIQKDTGRP